MLSVAQGTRTKSAMLVLVDASACGVAGKTKLTLDATPASLGDLRLALCSRLAAGGLDAARVRVEHWDSDFEEWTTMENLDELRDKARLRLLPLAAEPEPEPAVGGVETRLMQRDGASEDVHSPIEGFQAARLRPPHPGAAHHHSFVPRPHGTENTSKEAIVASRNRDSGLGKTYPLAVARD